MPEKIDPTQGEESGHPILQPIPLNQTHSAVQTKIFSITKCIQTIFITAVVMATAFTMWTPTNLFNNPFLDQMLIARENASLEPTPGPEYLVTSTIESPQNRVGIIAGHWKNDSGAVCDDGLTEAELNVRIATLIKQQLIDAGYQVDLLAEFDPALQNFEGLALISIHNDSCAYIEGATGYKISSADNLNHPEQSQRLKDCVISRYGVQTGLAYNANTITNHMENYHAFREINPNTPAIIIETGFMNLDREILTKNSDVVAKGVADGILCFLRNEPVQLPQTPSDQ